jgi:hypothetical protein
MQRKSRQRLVGNMHTSVTKIAEQDPLLSDISGDFAQTRETEMKDSPRHLSRDRIHNFCNPRISTRMNA